MSKMMSIMFAAAITTVAGAGSAIAQQTGSETFLSSGEINGREFNQVTINHDNNTITWHYVDGGQFTQWTSPEMLRAIAERLRARNIHE